MKQIVSLLLILVPLSAHSGKPSKFRRECAQTSKEFKNNLPTTLTTVWCANDKRRDFGKMGHDVLHAMAVAAFYEKRIDRRKSAMNLLEKYDCNTKFKCTEFYRLIDWGLKSGQMSRYNKKMVDRAMELRESLLRRLESF